MFAVKSVGYHYSNIPVVLIIQWYMMDDHMVPQLLFFMIIVSALRHFLDGGNVTLTGGDEKLIRIYKTKTW